VGWRERDYAKLRDDERRALFGGTGSRDYLPPRQARRRARMRVMPALLVAVGLSAVAAAAMRGHLDNAIHRAVPSVLPSADSAPRRDVSDVVGVHWRATDIAPASTAGRICLSMETHGRVCATYAIGEKPADVLTRRLESVGLRVQSVG
jgi:hypothetical protein